MKNNTLKVFILKHIANEDAGTILDFLKKERIPHAGVNLYAGEVLPALDQARALVIMGGPMNVYEEEKYPFLKEETAFLKKVIDAKIPCLGICLGSQLLAKSLGKRVYEASQPEIGWSEVLLTQEARNDEIFSSLGRERLKVLQWHEDTFDLPDGAVHLAASTTVKNQAFRFGDRVYGLQFHVEVNKAMLEDWFKKSPELPKILTEYDNYHQKLDSLTESFYEKFFGIE